MVLKGENVQWMVELQKQNTSTVFILNKNGSSKWCFWTLGALEQRVYNSCIIWSLFFSVSFILLSLYLPALVTLWFLIFLNFTTGVFIIILFILKDPYWRRTISGRVPSWRCFTEAALAPLRCNYVLLLENKCN